MAAVDGLEPPDAGIKIQCLTIWLNRYVLESAVLTLQAVATTYVL